MKQLFLSLFLCVTLISCSMNTLSVQELNIKMPEWPPEFSSDLYPQLAFWQVQIIQNKDEKLFVSDFITSSCEIKVRNLKNSPLCVTAKPITKNCNGQNVSFFYKAGTIYPFIGNHCLELKWQDGFTADIMGTLLLGCKKKCEGFEYVRKFNWKRFNDEISKKTLSVNNPWLLDRNQILLGISNNDFSVNDISSKNTFTINKNQLINDNNFLLSPYIPENEKILSEGTISLKKDVPNSFYTKNDVQIIILGNSDTFFSAEYSFLPIFIEEYEEF